jgi:hypothetical protein
MAGKAIAAVKAHYEYFSKNRRSITVPEWRIDGQPMIIFWKPVTTAMMRRAMGVDRSLTRINAELICALAEDESGAKMFDDIADAHVLDTEGAHEVVSRIASAMLRAPQIEDVIPN